MLVEDLDSHDDSLLMCGENMDAHPISKVSKILSAETPLARVQLKIPSMN